MPVREIWRFNVAVTDDDWFEFLRRRPDLDEINFWQPSPSVIADAPGTPWLFKLHAPRNVVVGGGFLSYYARLPVGVAWDTFGVGNGVESLDAMLSRVAHYRKVPQNSVGDVGCVILGQPFFLHERDWIPIPFDWSKNIVRGKHYEVGTSLGAALWREIALRLNPQQLIASPFVQSPVPALGKPILIAPRLGQGSFRVAVLDAYGRRCAVTGERMLPALEAAHIKPFAIVKNHSVNNGLSLRSDLHHLYDQGYLTVRPDLTLAVSKRIRAEFENGRDYYALVGTRLRVPTNELLRPDPSFLEWHFAERFLA